MQEKIIKIDNCPFCGHPIYAVNTYKANTDVTVFIIRCRNCGCSIERLSRNEVILAWNNRRKG